jgi:undecaprenyl-diphosphatase
MGGGAFIIGVLIAFLPAAVLGALLGSFVKARLFDVRIVCVMFILGGFVLLWVDRMNLKRIISDRLDFRCRCICHRRLPMHRHDSACRSGATIVGAMLFGADRRSAAEFSFWLAMPTMVGAFAYEAFKSRHG